MLKPLTFDRETEALVGFVEETDPGELVARSVALRRRGESREALLRAAALAVTRSTELPPDHHGGPIHPVLGIPAVQHLAARLPAPLSELPVLQSLALANKHVQAPEMGPTLMADLESAGPAEAGLEASPAALAEMIAGHRQLAAERVMTALLRRGERAAVLSVLLDAAIRRNSLDDHYFLYVVQAARALDGLGWDWAPTLLRPPVRYLAGNALMEGTSEFEDPYVQESVARYRAFGAIAGLVDDYALLDRDLSLTSGPEESDAIGALGRRLAERDDLTAVPGALAEALAGGLSLMGALEALSYACGLLYLRTTTANPFDVHMHTGLNARRYLIGLDTVPLRTKLLALLGWADGPEVRLAAGTVGHPMPGPGPARSAGEPLAALRACLEAQPPFDLDASDQPVETLRESPGVQEALRLATAYARGEHDPEPCFALLAELVCRDDATEMHAYKMQQAAYEEYRASRPPYRWVHLAAAARHLATVHGLRPRRVYPEAARALDL